MFDHERCVRFESISALKLAGFLLAGCSSALRGIESLVDFLEIGRFVIKSLEVQSLINRIGSLVSDGIAHLYSLDSGTSIPTIGGVIRERGVEAIKISLLYTYYAADE